MISKQRKKIPTGSCCLCCAHSYQHPENNKFVFCLDLDRWQPHDYVCGRYMHPAEKALAQIYGPPELGLQIEAGLE